MRDPSAAHLAHTAPAQHSDTGICAQNGSLLDPKTPAGSPGQASSQGDTAVQPSMWQQDLATASSESAVHETAPREEEQSSGQSPKHKNGTGMEQEEILVRFAEQGASMLRTASAVFGAPYDMADLSEGGAIADMLRRLQSQEPD